LPRKRGRPPFTYHNSLQDAYSNYTYNINEWHEAFPDKEILKRMTSEIYQKQQEEEEENLIEFGFVVDQLN
jgi:hypothetical protein